MPIIDYAHRAEQDKKLVFSDPKISPKNKADLKKYLESRQNITATREGIILRHIKLLFYEIPDVVGSMQDRDLINSTFKALKKKIKPGYYETVKNVGKAFVRWHNDNETPGGWKDVKSCGKKEQMRDLYKEDMISWEEGQKLINATNSVQFKAVIAVQLDGGFRPSEFIDLTYGDIEKSGSFYVATIKAGKTGKRQVILYDSARYLQAWLHEHPIRKANAPLWVVEYAGYSHPKKGKSKENARYDYWALRKRLLDLGERIDFKKPLDFYALRHSACYNAKMQNTSPDLAAKKFGHSVEYYTETYGRLDVSDDVKRFQKLHGVDGEEQTEQMKTLNCPRCDCINNPGVNVCDRCGSPLTMQAAVQKAEEMDSMKKDLSTLQEQMAQIIAAQSLPAQLDRVIAQKKKV